ncbi:MAG: cytochrome c oxidase subunit 3 [Bacteroidota bacterium]|nr:cytochrome c oxidase subunit 3 [Bacteroidota bacterium]
MATDTLDKTHTEDHHGTENGSWEGGAYPFKVGYGKLMIWYFLLSDAFTFAGFLIAYGTLRFSSPSWPVPDFVFSTFPILGEHNPLLFVTLMTFVLLFSSFTMIRAVQEGHRENRRGVIKWMSLTILGGLGFLGCQAWEWTTLISVENMTVSTDPFGTHIEDGVYLGLDGKESAESFEKGHSYLIHRMDVSVHAAAANGADVGNAGHGTTENNVAHPAQETESTLGEIEGTVAENNSDANALHSDSVAIDQKNPTAKQETIAREQGAVGEGTSHAQSEPEAAHTDADAGRAEEHAESEGGHTAHHYAGPGDYPDAVVDEHGYIHRKFIVSSGENTGLVKSEAFGPKAFGALFFFITGFHGFHVFSGVIFLTIIMINVMSGIYIARRNKNEMVEKIGLYWHFVDLVWVFVFLVFYLL